jgi:hypothetical protein
MKLTDLPNGLHLDVPPEVYHQSELGLVNCGGLKAFEHAPAAYKIWVDGGVQESQTPALLFGAAFHCAALEPKRFAEAYAVEPQFGDCRKSDNKTARDKWREANASRLLLSPEDAASITAMVASLHAHPLVGPMLSVGQPEATVLWRDQATGLRCKARPDLLATELSLCLDLKSTGDATAGPFDRTVFSYLYHCQAAHYLEGLAAIERPVDHFIFGAVEKTPPFLVALYALDDESLDAGSRRNHRLMASMAECLRTGSWPGLPTTITTLHMPRWLAAQSLNNY